MPPRLLLLVTLPVLALPLAAQVSSLSLIDARGAIRSRVDSICRTAEPTDPCRLSQAFAARWTAASRGFPPEVAAAAQAALQAAARAVAADPHDAASAELLAALTLELSDRTYRIRGPASLEEFRDALWPAIKAGNRSPLVLRACVGLSLAVNDPPTARHCAAEALSRGKDSTWHYLRLMWLDLMSADSTAALSAFASAVNASGDTAMEAELAQVLGQFFAYDPPPGARRPPPVAAVIRQRWEAMPVEQRLGDAWTLLGSASEVTMEPARQRLLDEMAMWRYGGNDFESCPLVLGDNRAQIQRRCAARSLEPPGYNRPAVSASVAQLWHPGTEEPGVLVIGSIGDERSDPMRQRITIRTWIAPEQAFRDTSFAMTAGEACGGTARSACVTAWLGGQAMPTSWSFATAGAGRIRGRFVGALPPTRRDDQVLSSPLLGQLSDSMTWNVAGQRVAVSTDNRFDRDEPVELYFQVRSDADHIARLRIVIEQLDDATAVKASSTVESRLTLHAGLNHVTRTLELSRLPKGPGRVRIELSLDGGTWAGREAGFTLR